MTEWSLVCLEKDGAARVSACLTRICLTGVLDTLILRQQVKIARNLWPQLGARGLNQAGQAPN